MGQVIDIRTQVADPTPVVVKAKLCVRCRADKPREEFRTNKKLRDGLHSYCRKCDSEIASRYNKEARKDWAVRLLQNARASTAGGGNIKRKLKTQHWEPVNLTVEYLRELYDMQDGKCAYFNIVLQLDGGMGLRSITLDRLDCDRGYVQGNVVLACRAANLARGNASTDDMHVLVEMIKRS